MRKAVRNTFTKGMNQDSAFTIFGDGKYFNANNSRVLTDDNGQSTGSLTSVRGNKYDFTIPDVGDSWVISINITFIDSFLDGTNQILDLTIRGVNKQIPFRTTEVKVFYETVAAFINGGLYGASVNVVAQNTASEIVLFSTDFSFIAPVSSTDSDVRISISSQGGTDLGIIGSIDLRDSVILFTAPVIENDSGQIWDVTWDSMDIPSLRLIRNRKDYFTRNHPIQAVSRYETKDIRRVYWTDNNLSIRTLNIESESAYIDEIDILPSVEFDVPIPVKLNQTGGNVPSGSYAAAYKLKELGGSETSFSSFSPIFKVHENDEVTETYADYQGSNLGVATTKSIDYRIDNIDTSFSNIDILIVSYDSSNLPTYYLIEENSPLLGSSSYTFSLSSIKATQIIDEAAVLLQPAAFLTAKSLTIKDNRLLPANVKDVDLSLENWDSTAARYNNTGTTSDGYENTTNKINIYNKDSTRAPISGDQHKFKLDGSTVGGEGSNVSFKFINRGIILDLFGGTGDTQPFLNTAVRLDTHKGQTDAVLNGKTLPMGGLWRNYKNPFIESWFKGYMRSEVYRFGVVFFDLKGRASAVKWIADIRMPDGYDNPTFTQTATELQGNILGIEFTVTIDADIRSRFTGFSIVRSLRSEEDSTIIGQGLVGDTTTITIASVSGNVGYPTPFDASTNIGALIRTDRLTSYGQTVEPLFKCIDVPEWKMRGKPSVDGFKIRPVAAVAPTLFARMDTGGSVGDSGYYARYYNTSALSWYADLSTTDNIPSLSATIEESLHVPYTDPALASNPIQAIALSPVGTAGPRTDAIFQSGPIKGFLNYMAVDEGLYIDPDGSPFTPEIRFRTRGTRTDILKCTSMHTVYTKSSRILSTNDLLSNGVWFPGPPVKDSVNSGILVINAPVYGKKLIANIYRELSSQYGGDTISAVESTNYMTTGHYQSFSSQDSNDTYTVSVYGGDTYINIYDETIGMAHHQRGISSGFPFVVDSEDNARMSSIFFPVESTINLDMRQGSHFSAVGNSSAGGTSSNVIDYKFPNDDFALSNQDPLEHTNISFKSLSSFRNNTTEYDNRIHASDPKINGEPGDSWTSFKPLNFIDVDGNHGPINQIITFKDEVLFFQDSAYGAVAVNPRVTVQGADDVEIELGVGGILHDFNYYSTTIGSKHQWSVFQSSNAVYWFNILNKKTYRYFGHGSEEMVDIKGMHSFYASNIDETLESVDNPLLNTGIHGTYDFLNKEVLFTFLGQHREKENFTLGYSEAIDAWTSFFDFLPTHYVNSKNRLLSPNPQVPNRLYRHNKGEYLQFYENFYDLKLSIVVNPESNETKMFENISYHTNVRNENGYSLDQVTFEEFNCHTNYQHSGIHILTPGSNIKRKEREWNFVVPRNIMKETGSNLNIFDASNYDTSRIYKDKMRDKYMVQNYKVKGTIDSDQFIIDYINTFYRVSAR